MKGLTFGEIMLRLCAPNHERLFQTPSLEATFGGGEANTAVSLANYGMDVQFCTVLPDNLVGDACISELRRFGVDVSKIQRGPGRMGIYYLETGANQLPSKVVYDRLYSSLSLAKPSDIDWNVAFQGVNWFHITGITPAISETAIKGQLKELVRGSVEETLNELLEAEANKLTQAARYERNEQRQGYRSGHYNRNLTTTSGDVTLKVPKLKGISFETAIIERYRRRESSVEEALIEMYLAGVSVRRVEDITEALWGSKVSPSTISELNKKAYVHIEDWRNRPLQGGRYPYVYVDGIYLRRNWGGEFENVAILVAIAVNEDGYREVLGAAEGMKEDKASWVNFFQWLRGRGLDGVKLVVGDKCLGMLEAVGEVFPEAKYQRCTVHFYRNVFAVTPRSKAKLVAKMLKAIHAQGK